MKIYIDHVNKRKFTTCLQHLFAFLFFFALSTPMLFAQDRNIKGTVTDDSGDPIVGVTITIVGKNDGTITDLNGKYSLRASGGVALKFEYLGFKSQIINVNANKNELNVTMVEDAIQLEETVITAMNIRRSEKSLASVQQKVDVSTMTEARDGNLLNMLSGKVAGLQVRYNPGGSTRIETRGNGSLTGNNQPLFVVDGVPIVNNMGEDKTLDLDFGNPANNINPDDVEDMTVLRGANAAALYGSDAANGVVLITTKKGSRKKGLGVTVSSNIQMNRLSQYPQYQNVYGTGSMGRLHTEYNIMGKSNYTYDPNLPWGIARFGNEYNKNSYGMPMLGFDVVGRNGEIKKYVPNSDNVTDMYRTGYSWINSVSVEKMTDITTFRFSYTNTTSNDILENFNEISKNAFSARATAKITDFLDVDLNARYNNESADNRGYRNASDRNPIYVVSGLPRDISEKELTPWKNPDGTAIVTKGFVNPYWVLNELSNEDEKNWLLADFTVNLKLTKDLKLRLKGAIDMNTSQGYSFVNMYTTFDPDGEYREFTEIYRSNTYEALLNYNKRWKKFNLSASVGTSAQDYKRKKENIVVMKLLQPDNKTISNNGGVITSWQDYDSKKKQAVFGTASLGYNDFIYLELTGRNDWSSTLPAANRSYFYSSAGTSFIFSEAFKIPKRIIEYGKLRASIASVGNDTGFDKLLDGYSYGRMYLGNMPWYKSDNVKKNPNLKPERTLSYEAGLDLRFWDNRVNLDFTYYDKTTRDQILESSISSASGYNQSMYNAGKIRNWGTEISLKVVPIRSRFFEWATTINWAKNNSEVISLAENMDYFSFPYGKHHASGVELRAVVGRSYGTLYGPDWRRDENGRVLVDGNGRTMISSEPVMLGDISHDWMGGWNNSFKIGKNIDVSVLIDFKKGGLIWSGTAFMGALSGQTVETLKGREEFMFSNWILGENDDERRGYLQINHTIEPGASINTVPYYDDERLSGIRIPNAYYDSSVENLAGQQSFANLSPEHYWAQYRNTRLFLYDASFIKLREISVGYNFSKDLMKKIKFFNSIKVSAVGRNLAILYQKTPKGVDPEASTNMGRNGQGIENGFSLPSMSFGANVKLTF